MGNLEHMRWQDLALFEFTFCPIVPTVMDLMFGWRSGNLGATQQIPNDKIIANPIMAYTIRNAECFLHKVHWCLVSWLHVCSCNQPDKHWAHLCNCYIGLSSLCICADIFALVNYPVETLLCVGHSSWADHTLCHYIWHCGCAASGFGLAVLEKELGN